MMSFSKEIIQWYATHKRALPWRDTKDPYLIWLSEVILQQTRVAQGMSYYHLFAESFPDVQSLADADEDTVLRMWQGLGYYSRARNLHKAAKKVVNEYNGLFPTRYETLLTLPGVGEYTAAAVSSFAADEVRAVVDGNVFRVLSRFWGLATPINSSKGKKGFTELANSLIDSAQPAVYNQAIMEFGALQCKPKLPECNTCPLNRECFAFSHQVVDDLPVKIKKAKSRNRYFYYFIIQKGEELLIEKRGAGDIWQHLHDFPLVESEKELTIEGVVLHPEVVKSFGSSIKMTNVSEVYKHILSHQNIFARFIVLEDVAIDLEENEKWNYVLIKELDRLAKPKLIVSFLENYLLTKTS